MSPWPTARWWPSPRYAPALGSKVAARYGIPRVYPSHTEMLAQEQLDGIVASQPFTRHGVLVPDLLKAGVPVFTEKPLAASVQVGEKILEAVAEQRHLAHGRLSQAQRPGNDGCQGGDRAPEERPASSGA